MRNVERVAARVRHSGFCIDSSFVIRLPRRSSAKPGHSSLRAAGAFTLIELVVVFGLILVLTGLVLSTAGYARKKGARARAETEIAAMSAACESYKADNGAYPANAATNSLNPKTNGNPGSTPCPPPCPDPGALTAYSDASVYLYMQLSGDTSANLQPPAGAKSYFTFKAIPPSADGTSNSGMLSITRSGNTYTVNYIRDPFGNSYGYSTINNPVANPSPTPGNNPTFDLWSTSGLTTTPPTAPITQQWIKNW